MHNTERLWEESVYRFNSRRRQARELWARWSLLLRRPRRSHVAWQKVLRGAARRPHGTNAKRGTSSQDGHVGPFPGRPHGSTGPKRAPSRNRRLAANFRNGRPRGTMHTQRASSSGRPRLAANLCAGGSRPLGLRLRLRRSSRRRRRRRRWRAQGWRAQVCWRRGGAPQGRGLGLPTVLQKRLEHSRCIYGVSHAQLWITPIR